MPGPLVDGALKRKRTKRPESPQKRAKSESSDDEDNAETQILLLENAILESKKNYNNITKLLELAQTDGDHDTILVALVSLGRVFLRLLAQGNLAKRQGQSEKDDVVVQWLRDRFGDYKTLLVQALGSEPSASTALTLAMRILKAESQHLSNQSEYAFPRVSFKEIVKAIVRSDVEDVRQEFCEKFLGEFADIRFFTFRALKDIVAVGISDSDIRNDIFNHSFEMLSFFEEIPDELDQFYIEPPKKHAVTSVNQHKKHAQEAWLAVLNLASTKEQRKEILEAFTDSIIPWFSKPELLMDFLTDSYNSGGSVSLLALSGVFYLIQERNLDYPSFYRKLYSLLDANIMHSKHRSRFLRLMDTFLASTHLPAVLVASFLKRLARLSLNAPPAAIVAVIPWIYNTLKRHPLCTFMIHRAPRTVEEKATYEVEGLEDPFLPDEEDPMESRAINSCLWEVVQLQSHYHPNVATIAKIISEQFTKQSYNMEDFLDHSYGSLLDAEFAKQVKKAPVVEFMIPKRIFLPQDLSSGVEDSLLVKLWDFK